MGLRNWMFKRSLGPALRKLVNEDKISVDELRKLKTESLALDELLVSNVRTAVNSLVNFVEGHSGRTQDSRRRMARFDSKVIDSMDLNSIQMGLRGIRDHVEKALIEEEALSSLFIRLTDILSETRQWKKRLTKAQSQRKKDEDQLYQYIVNLESHTQDILNEIDDFVKVKEEDIRIAAYLPTAKRTKNLSKNKLRHEQLRNILSKCQILKKQLRTLRNMINEVFEK